MEIVNEHVLGLIGRQQTSSEIDYVDSNGVLHRGANAPVVQIESASVLENLPEGTYSTGTIAYISGFRSAWQLAADGTWVPILVEEG